MFQFKNSVFGVVVDIYRAIKLVFILDYCKIYI